MAIRDKETKWTTEEIAKEVARDRYLALAALAKAREDDKFKRRKKLLEHYMQIARTIGIFVTIGLQIYIITHVWSK